MPKTKFLGAIVEGLSDGDEETFMSVLHNLAQKMGVTVSGSVGLYKGEKVAKKTREDQKDKGWYQRMKDGDAKTKKSRMSPTGRLNIPEPQIQNIPMPGKKSARTILEEAAPKEKMQKTSKKKVRILSEEERKHINW